VPPEITRLAIKKRGSIATDKSVNTKFRYIDDICMMTVKIDRYFCRISRRLEEKSPNLLRKDR